MLITTLNPAPPPPSHRVTVISLTETTYQAVTVEGRIVPNRVNGLHHR